MRGFVIGLILSFLVLPASAQITADSVFKAASPKAKFVFNFDTRYTLVQNNQARISGLKAGIEWKQKFRTGLGMYALSSPLVTKFTTNPDQKVAEVKMKFRYAAVYGEWVLLRNKHWELSAPLQVGFGEIRNQYFDKQDQLLQTDYKPLWLIEPSVAAHYKIYTWVGLGAGAGYRQMLNHQQLQNNQLNAPIYYIKVKVFVGDLYRQFRQKHPCALRVTE